MKRSRTIDRVLRGQLCTGCGLCASLADGAVEMRMIPPGYSRPTQTAELDSGCEAKIAATCPGVSVAAWDDGGSVDPYWGPYRQVTTGHAVDPLVRFEGSSGGAVSALLIHALESGLVDRVIHIAADPERPTRNVTTCSRTAEEVIAGAGSRYTASSPLAQIEEALSEGGSLAFVGKPCDISALRRLGEIDPRVDRHVRIAISFFCGGMPSHNGVERILTSMGVDLSEVVAFRYRGRGWPGRTAAVTRSGQVAEMSYAKSWGAHLSHEVQFRCKICSDAVGGAADIACADAWYGGESGYPSFDEQDGRSLIIARSAGGEELLASAVTAGALAIEPLDLRQVNLMQPSQARRKRLVAARTLALAATGQPRPKMRGTWVREASRTADLTESLRNFLGTMRRILLGRR